MLFHLHMSFNSKSRLYVEILQALLKNHRFYIKKKNCEKRENISWDCEALRKNVHEIK